MEEFILRIASELPYVAVLLIIFWVLRGDILVLIGWFQELVEKLISKLDGDDTPIP